MTTGATENSLHLLTKSFSPVCIFRDHAEGSLKVVMNLVNVLVDAFVMQCLVDKVVPSVLYDETTYQLSYYHIPGEIDHIIS